MDALLLLLRAVHVVGGVFWAGVAWFIAFYLTPAAQAAGPAGGQVMQRIAQTGLTRAISIVAGLTILAGLALYWRDSGGLRPEVVTGGPGLGFGFGGLAAVAGYAVGLAVTRPAVERIGHLGREIAAAGGPPTPAQASEMAALQERINRGGRLVAYLLGVAALLMAVARHL